MNFYLFVFLFSNFLILNLFQNFQGEKFYIIFVTFNILFASVFSSSQGTNSSSFMGKMINHLTLKIYKIYLTLLHFLPDFFT